MALTHKPKAEGFPPYAMALDTFAGVRAEMGTHHRACNRMDELAAGKVHAMSCGQIRRANRFVTDERDIGAVRKGSKTCASSMHTLST